MDNSPPSQKGGRLVPNAPCGVERTFHLHISQTCKVVPNAPCGVERQFQLGKILFYPAVPNAPCGVESLHSAEGKELSNRSS